MEKQERFYFDIWIALLSTLAGMVNVVTLLLFFTPTTHFTGNSCAMKVSTSVASGYKSVLMAMDETHVTGNEGIVEHDLDRTIDNLCSIASKSMHHIDRQVIEIMVSKPCP